MKVLLVDDEILTIRMLQKVIPWKELGLELMDYAGSGEEAYEKVLRENPDIIISDIRMSGMDGLTFLKKVRAYDARIKAILMSAYADFSYVREGMKLGCSDYILKPVDEWELEGALRKVIGEIQGAKEQEKAIQTSTEQLERMNLYQYMRTGSGKHKVLKARGGFKLENYCIFVVQRNSETIEEYNISANLEMGDENYILHTLEQTAAGWVRDYVVFEYMEGGWTLLLNGIKKEQREGFARALFTHMEREIGVGVTVSFSLIGQELEELPGLYGDVQMLSKYRFALGECEILGYDYNCTREELEQNMQSMSKLLPKKTERHSKNYSKLVQESIDLIEKNYKKNLSLEDICEEISVSKSYFCYLFKRETGMSLWNYLTVVRLKEAKRLLRETDLRSYEIAFQVGYDNPSYFSKIFKKYENRTPNEYRESIGED